MYLYLIIAKINFIFQKAMIDTLIVFVYIWELLVISHNHLDFIYR